MEDMHTNLKLSLLKTLMKEMSDMEAERLPGHHTAGAVNPESKVTGAEKPMIKAAKMKQEAAFPQDDESSESPEEEKMEDGMDEGDEKPVVVSIRKRMIGRGSMVPSKKG